MARGFIFKMDKGGVGDLLKSGRVKGNLVKRARSVARQAGQGMEVSGYTGETRVNAHVITATHEARYAEATGKVLTKAIDAGRG